MVTRTWPPPFLAPGACADGRQAEGCLGSAWVARSDGRANVSSSLSGVTDWRPLIPHFGPFCTQPTGRLAAERRPAVVEPSRGGGLGRAGPLRAAAQAGQSRSR